jgi:hypothetical protein
MFGFEKSYPVARCFPAPYVQRQRIVPDASLINPHVGQAWLWLEAGPATLFTEVI